MKTEVKFRELPEKVQGFLLRTIGNGNDWIDSDNVRLNWLHNIPEWNRATDEERLAYAEWRYPVGTVLAKSGINDWVRPEILMPIENCKFSLHENIIDTQDGYGYVYCKETNRWADIVSEPEEKPLFKVGDRPEWTPELINQLPHGTVLKCASFETEFVYNGEPIRCVETGSFGTHKNGIGQYIIGYLYCKIDDTYAEIVSLPDIKEASPSAQQEFVKANPDMKHVEEFQAGEIVEYIYMIIDDKPHWKGCRFTGGMSSDGLFIVELDKIIFPTKEIRKIDPDRQHVEGFEAGKIVNVWNRDDKVDFQQAKYRFFADGKHWVETCSADLVVTFKNIEKIADSDLKEVEEPKAGDMVETREEDFEAWGPGWFYTGGRTKDGRYICEGKNRLLIAWKTIRLPQKSEVESKAKEILNYYNNQFSEFYNEGEQRTKQMILTAIKWGQANPDKI